jgi:hypothetical protein
VVRIRVSAFHPRNPPVAEPFIGRDLQEEQQRDIVDPLGPPADEETIDVASFLDGFGNGVLLPEERSPNLARKNGEVPRQVSSHVSAQENAHDDDGDDGQREASLGARVPGDPRLLKTVARPGPGSSLERDQ